MSGVCGWFGRRWELEVLNIAVLILQREDERVLFVYNKNWGAFTLPMSKQHRLRDKKLQDPGIVEPIARTACRARAECVGEPVAAPPLSLLPEPIVCGMRSDRDGGWKEYKLHVFKEEVEGDPALAPCLLAVWLNVNDVIGAGTTLEPISPTARRVLNELRLAGLI